MLGRYLSTVRLWTLRKHSTLHGLCGAQTYKYPYGTWNAVEFFPTYDLLSVLSKNFQTTFGYSTPSLNRLLK